MIENIFFDFDGVIADSVNVKTEAFKQLYLKYGDEIAAKVVHHHIQNGGMSRFEKFKYYHKEYLSITLDETGLDELTSALLIVIDLISGSIVASTIPLFHTSFHVVPPSVVVATPITKESLSWSGSLEHFCLNDRFKLVFPDASIIGDINLYIPDSEYG